MLAGNGSGSVRFDRAVYSEECGAYREGTPKKPSVMTRDSQKPIRAILRISFPGEDRLGRGKMELLEHIRETGSISAAGRAMDMSYRRAWLLVSDLNRMFETPAIESQRGGQKGGGAVLTAFGEMLLQRFRAMERAMDEALGDDLAWLAAHYRPDPPEKPSTKS